ncbi:bifunctional (p)ppGpp synthetase/guanosine-3',5'-bis(diphosphate) 3'-pyrophosphohydrolase [Candidatus Peregrinibacteria bacterium]|nr:bifunctional (p)ppGpp synthetase/guanosine-3',5'-bis(diphosphate) 3'-pyrophosphohydrolase [Candidatus Peregrinibacteria bacterium]
MKFSAVIKKAKSYLPFLNRGKLMRAYNFAKKAHRGQKRLGGQSYLSHPVFVTEILTHFFADEDILIAALLHDVLEDTAYTIKDIKKRFGQNVALLVDGVTKLDKAQYPYDRAARKIESLKKFFRLSEKDLRVILIKLADRLHNMSTIKYLPIKRRVRFATETQDVYIPLANLLGMWSVKNELEDLCFECLKPAQYNKIKNEYQRYCEELREINKKTIGVVSNALKKNNFHADIEPRKKSLFSYYQKFADNGNKNEVLKTLSFYIIVPKVKDCYSVLGILHGLFKPRYGRIKDYIAIPKANNYRSLHTAVFGISGVPAEFQIRTPQMHKIDEFGMLSNIHKFSVKNPQKASRIIREKTKWLQKVLEIGDGLPHHQNFLDNLKMDVFQNRIFTFTPKGDIIDLPEGATALDFAYAVLSDVGHRALKAEIDGAAVSVTTHLKTGDTVKIITAKKPCPRLEWLNLVKTADAKQKIKTYFKEESEGKCHKFGRKLLESELTHFQKINLSKIPEAKIRLALEKFEAGDLKKLLIMVGRGEVLPKEVLNAIFSEEEVLSGKTFSPHKKSSRALYPVKIIINFKDRVGLFRDIASTISRFNVNIVKVSVQAPPDKSKIGAMEMIIEIKELNQLMDVFTALEQVENIIGVHKK